MEAHWVSERRGRERLSSEQPPYSILARGIESGLSCRSASSTGWACSAGARSQEAGSPAASDRQGQQLRRAARMPARYDLNDPANAAKLAAVDQLTELAGKAGYSLPELAVAFVLEHPAVTSAIIGPRTMEQLTSLLKSDEIRLDGAILDRIDEIVPPGTDLNLPPWRAGWAPPWLASRHCAGDGPRRLYGAGHQ